MGSARRRGSNSWLLDFCGPNGRQRETVRVRTRAEAERELKKREGDYAYGRAPFAAPDKVTFENLTTLLLQDYANNRKLSIGKARKSVERLAEFFAGWRAVNITGADVGTYIEKRLRAGYAAASVNRELAALKRGFRLAVKHRLISHDHVPHIAMLKERPPRAGFFEAEQFQAVLHRLRPEIKPVALFAHETGWRLREVLGLERRNVDLREGYARLDPGTTKNNEGRVAYLSPELLAILRAQDAATRELEREKAILIPWTFHRRGRRILRFLASWQTACRLAGVPGMYFHDLRRTAVRNMVRAGVPERVAMQISGHKTRSVFERYNIVSEGDLREAAKRLSAHNNGSADRHRPVAGGPDSSINERR